MIIDHHNFHLNTTYLFDKMVLLFFFQLLVLLSNLHQYNQIPLISAFLRCKVPNTIYVSPENPYNTHHTFVPYELHSNNMELLQR